MKIFNGKTNSKRAFTLVELLVALGVFSVVMMISLGSVVSILDAGRKAKALKSVMTNLNFTLEVMTREMKFGKNYYCGIDTSNPHTATQSCSGSTSITFTNSDGTDIIYRLNGTQIEKSTDHGSTYLGVTSPEVTIRDLKFYVYGTAAYPGDTNQPRIFVLLRGYAGPKQTLQSNFILQTTISQRLLDK